jgi:hypothetical protein
VLTGNRVTKWVTIATDSGGRQRTLPDDRSQVKFVAARAVQTASWLWDEEANRQGIGIDLEGHARLSDRPNFPPASGAERQIAG